MKKKPYGDADWIILLNQSCKIMLKQKQHICIMILLFVVVATCLIALHTNYTSNGFNDIATDIEAMASNLGYTSDSCRHLVAMVRSWDLPTWKSRVLKAKCDSQVKSIPASQLATIEDEATHALYDHIHNAIRSSDEVQYFDLARIATDRKATCLGYSQLLYILCKTIGVPVQVVNVQKNRTGKEIHHVACMVHLNDNMDILADLWDSGFISHRFNFLDEYSPSNGSWELKHRDNPLCLHRKIMLWDNNELASAVYSQRADLKSRSGNFVEAIYDVNTAIARNPKNGFAFGIRAILDKHFRKFDDAISDASKAIESNPRSATALEIRGSAYSMMGDYKNAVSDFSQAIEINPHYGLAYAERGNSMACLGNFHEARMDWQKAVDLDSSLKELVKKYSESVEKEERMRGMPPEPKEKCN
jgi:tetratricopeptide (TPR) repeat protein